MLDTKNLPENCNDLFHWRTAELIIDSVLEQPNHCSDDQKENSCHRPHSDCKWLQERPSIRALCLNSGKYDKPRTNVWLGEINNFCPICDNSYIPNNSIKFLEKERRLLKHDSVTHTNRKWSLFQK